MSSKSNFTLNNNKKISGTNSDTSSSQKFINIALWVSRIFVGVLFIFSGWIKVNDIIGFSYKLDEYFSVFEAHFSFPAAPFIAISVPLAAFISVFEVILAFMLILGYKRKFTAYMLAGMIIFFTFLTGYSWITGSVKECGCFGDAFKLEPKESFFKDIILCGFIGVIFFYHNRIKPLLAGNLNKLAFYISSAGVILLCAYCYYFLPIVDFRKACKGCDLKYAAENGQLDYYSFGEEVGIDDFKGNRMLITMGHLEKMTPKDREKVISVYEELKGTGIEVLGGSCSVKTELEKHRKDYPFHVSSQDDVLLKTIVRSNPGFILIRNGIVIENWSKYEVPTKDEVLKELK